MRIRCPVFQCERERKRWAVVCAGHWSQVPAPLRQEVWRLYRREAGSAAHLAAIREVVRLLNGEGVSA